MAWGPNPNTEDELEKLASVREYFHEHFPDAEIRDSYDHDRLAQIFRIEMDGEDGFSDAVLFDTVSRRVSGEQVRKGPDGMAGRRTCAIGKRCGSDCVELGRRRTGSLSVGHAIGMQRGATGLFSQ